MMIMIGCWLCLKKSVKKFGKPGMNILIVFMHSHLIFFNSYKIIGFQWFVVLFMMVLNMLLKSCLLKKLIK